MLEQHLKEAHWSELRPLCDHMLLRDAPGAIFSAYKQAVAVKCRGCAPVAGASFDRLALADFTRATAGNRVAALVRFCCGGVHPYVEEVADKGPIQWYKPLKADGAQGELQFLGQPLASIQELLGLTVYLARYNVVKPLEQEAALTKHESFNDWQLRLPQLQDGVLLCCPEDCAASLALFHACTARVHG